MVKKLPLQNGMFALVDDEDYERCNKHAWFVSGTTTFRITSRIDGKTITLHKFIKKGNSSDTINFRDGDRTNFQKENLEEIKHKKKIHQNKGKRGSSSQYKGVYLIKKDRKWAAQIYFDGNKIHLGSFDNEDEAALVYNEAALKFHGVHAYRNVIGENNKAVSLEFEKNLKPRRKVLSSAYRGVSLNKAKGRYSADITKNGKKFYLGVFSCEIEAAKAYDEKAFELYGDKAILNFPNEK